MAKVKKLQVRTPQTTNGRNLLYDDNKNVIYSTSIVELASKKDFESLNAKLPKDLKHELTVIEVDTDSKKITISETAKQVDDAAIKAKEDEIAALKQKLADANSKPAAAFVISKIEEATTPEEVNELIEGDDRATVTKAANKKN
ncbi:MAG: hypothetical protein IPJ81_16075 [Chitinophagaceae bacterium]|nr:hypothetical protein [Chitinophagaceae bacterium]